MTMLSQVEQPELTFPKYPQVAGYKKEGTSKLAAETVDAPTLRDKCLQVLRGSPHTPDEIAAILERSVLSVRPRLSELIALGKVRETQERRLNSSGKYAAVLEAAGYSGN